MAPHELRLVHHDEVAAERGADPEEAGGREERVARCGPQLGRSAADGAVLHNSSEAESYSVLEKHGLHLGQEVDVIPGLL